MALWGVILDVLPEYRDALGVVKTPADLFVRSGPGILCAAIHASCALRAGARRSASSRFVGLCGVFDMVVGTLIWVPWAGMWIALLSPFSLLTFLAVYAPRAMIVSYVATSIATLAVGFWIVMQSVGMNAEHQARSMGR
jgi:hypothetical protein